MPCEFLRLLVVFPLFWRFLFSYSYSRLQNDPLQSLSEYHATLTNAVSGNIRYFIPRSSWLHNELTISLFSSLIMTYFCSLVHSRRIKLQPFPQGSDESTSLSSRVILRREVFAGEKAKERWKERKVCDARIEKARTYEEVKIGRNIVAELQTQNRKRAIFVIVPFDTSHFSNVPSSELFIPRVCTLTERKYGKLHK